MLLRKLTVLVILAVGFFLSVSDEAAAVMQRNPDGVNVSTSQPTSLAIRFADSAGGNFTTTEAFFCSVDPTGGAGVANANVASCAGSGGVILGRLPSALDSGSTSSAASSIFDVMTIPYSVARRAVVLAQRGEHSDFFYVRKFTPDAGVDIGAGAGVPVLVVVTCRLTAGTARTPISLSKVDIYGEVPGADYRDHQVVVTTDNVETGYVRAEIIGTGQGRLTGWWEVRSPTDPEIELIDRFTEASLPEADRGKQTKFRKIQPFSFLMPLDGKITIDGPSYKNLPLDPPGTYSVLLRFDLVYDRESLSNLASAGRSAGLYSGAVAGFALPVLDYWAEPGISGRPSEVLQPVLIRPGTLDLPASKAAVKWDQRSLEDLVVEIRVSSNSSGTGKSILAPGALGYVVIDQGYLNGIDLSNSSYDFIVRDKVGNVLRKTILVQRQ